MLIETAKNFIISGLILKPLKGSSPQSTRARNISQLNFNRLNGIFRPRAELVDILFYV